MTISLRAYECRPVFMGDNRAAIRTLLDVLAEGDLSVLPMLVDELSMAGDERISGIAVIERQDSDRGKEWQAKRFLLRFKELCDEALTVKDWDCAKPSRRLRFKQRMLKIGLMYYYRGGNGGTLRISYASPRQLEQVQHARYALLGEDRQDMPLFEERGEE